MTRKHLAPPSHLLKMLVPLLVSELPLPRAVRGAVIGSPDAGDLQMPLAIDLAIFVLPHPKEHDTVRASRTPRRPRDLEGGTQNLGEEVGEA